MLIYLLLEILVLVAPEFGKVLLPLEGVLGHTGFLFVGKALVLALHFELYLLHEHLLNLVLYVLSDRSVKVAFVLLVLVLVILLDLF